ncbi:hypothetical protein [Tardiphaga sp.]|uniref:hypothetical protein n=1 Tax=Tardiphaga sp. TaxID=1926292 RepID=UPI002609B012|nr:hypothetical protein [Tardiphaga sp.]MDB5617433.1 hypothetical protein [Tardiphaga sp.]
MKSQTLALRTGCLDDTSRLDLAVVEAHMLWPDDERARERSLETANVQFGVANSLNLPQYILAGLLPIAAEAAPLTELQEVAKKPFFHGLIAGRVLYGAVRGAMAAADDRSMGRIYGDIAKSIPAAQRLSRKTIENKVWPKYRPVAHFWASYVDHALAKGDTTFPCSIGRLGEFLAVAQAFRRLGETTSTPQSPTTILRHYDAVGVPANLAVPEIPIRAA